MQKKLTLCVFIFLLSVAAFNSLCAQVAFQWQAWQGRGYLYDNNYVTKTSDGGYITVGSSIDSEWTNNDYSVFKLDSAGNTQWSQRYGGSADEHASGIIQTSNGGYIIAGSTNSHDGDVSANHDTTGTYDYWIVKVDGTGTIVWEKSIGGSFDDRCFSIDKTNDGGCILTGEAKSADGDVTDHLGDSTDTNPWVVKIDSFGNIEWAKSYSSQYGGGFGHCIRQTADGGYAMIGYGFDGDSSFWYCNGGGAWLLKLSSTGAREWQKCYSYLSGYDVTCIEQTRDGGYAIAGIGPDSIGLADFGVVKVTSNGTLQWQRHYGGSGWEEAFSIKQTADGGYIVNGDCQSNNDGDVSGFHGTTDIWVVRLDPSGNLIWQRCIGGIAQDMGTEVFQDADGGYIVAGYGYSWDGDFTGNTSGEWIYLVGKLYDDYNKITGKCFIDLNSNYTQETGEPDLSNQGIMESTTGRFTFTRGDGSYELIVQDTGNFSVHPLALSNFTYSPVQQTASFSSLYQTDTANSFSFQPAGAFNDLCVSITPPPSFRRGFSVDYQISYENVGTIALAPVITFYLDTILTFSYASVTPSSVTADSVVWNLPMLQPFQSGNITVNVQIEAAIPIGLQGHAAVSIEPLIADIDPSCNYDSCVSIVTSSRDPNVIYVSRDTIFTTELPSPPYLNYTIYFQNTGNDTAFTVEVDNQLSSYLDEQTLQLISFSHNCITNYDPVSRNFEFRFNNILLPDSFVDEPGSHGYIHYKIKPFSSLAPGNVIPNLASIYFDFNDAVMTNTALTRIETPLMVHQHSARTNWVSAYPNPTTSSITLESTKENPIESLLVYSMDGKLLMSIFNIHSSIFTADLQALSGGIYFLDCLTANGSEKIKVVKY
jgi:hypothetical protein